MTPEEEQKVKDYMKQLESADSPNSYELLISEFKERALSNEIPIWFVFKEIINTVISDPTVWTKKPNQVFLIFYVLTDIGNEKAYALTKWFIQNCTEDVSIGSLELIATLITSFENLEFKELMKYAKSDNKATSALGFLILFNLFMEKRLSPESEADFFEFGLKYENPRYLLEVADIIKFKHKEHLAQGDSEILNIQE